MGASKSRVSLHPSVIVVLGTSFPGPCLSAALLLFSMCVFMALWVLLHSDRGSPHARTLLCGLASPRGHRWCVHASPLPLRAPALCSCCGCVALGVCVWAPRLPGGVCLGGSGLSEGLWGYFVRGFPEPLYIRTLQWFGGGRSTLTWPPQS